MQREKITCDDCGTDFHIEHESESDEILYCPFCGADLYFEDDEDLVDEWALEVDDED
jgi:peptide subunit release factor 1 (eRF1)